MFLHVAVSLYLRSSFPLPLDRCLPSPHHQLLTSEIKPIFHQAGLLIGFWEADSWTPTFWWRYQECQCIKVREPGEPPQTERANLQFLYPVLFYFDFQGIGWWLLPLFLLLPLGRAIFFNLSTDSNANLFQRHSHRHTYKLVYQTSGYPLAKPSWHIKLTIVTFSRGFFGGAVVKNLPVHAGDTA